MHNSTQAQPHILSYRSVPRKQQFDIHGEVLKLCYSTLNSVVVVINYWYTPINFQSDEITLLTR